MLKDVESPKGFDGAIETASRWLASRRTRRSFLGWLGRGSVLVAGGSAFVGLMAGRAEARVCGQSGVSPKCPTYDCEDAVWGWCWYANGCCSGGRLKKICDCCGVVNNVHGYCPSGTNVKCIVESCGTDPRVQTVPVARLKTDNAVAMATAFSRTRFAKNAKPIVVVSNADDALSAGIAASAAAALGGPLLLTAGNALDAQVIAEIQRLGSTDVKVVGLGLNASIDSTLTPYGRTVERPFSSTNHTDLSSEVATFVQGKTKTTRAICVEASGASFAMAPIAAAAAASKGMLFLVGSGNAAQHANNGVVVTYMVGEEAAAKAGEVAGSKAIRSGGSIGMAAELAGYMSSIERTNLANVTLSPFDGNPGLAASPGVVVMHSRPGSLDGARDWMFSARPGFRQVFAVGNAGALNNDGYYEAQSLVNGFEAHLLIGVSGQGLPVISQPDSERPIGLARLVPVENAPTAPSPYWTNRG